METLKKIIESAYNSLLTEQSISLSSAPDIIVDRTKDERFGDFTTNLAMMLASLLKKNPREIANLLIAKIDNKTGMIDTIEVAGPGFINFFMKKEFWHTGFKQIFIEKEKFGSSTVGQNKKVHVEFISANPTGPLHVGHGRGAVVGDVISNILLAAGYDVKKEYYINDKGNQMNNLGKSTRARYLQLLGKNDVLFPENGYKGDYINTIAQSIIDEKGDSLFTQTEDETLPFFRTYSEQAILKEIKEDLRKFGIEFDSWYRETSLFENNKVADTLNALKEKNLTYTKDNALWLKTEELGDDKDRVLIKEDGEYTYFASDIAYHVDKFSRGFDQVIDIWGADHHGYVPRIKTVIAALGYPEGSLRTVLIQLVNLKRGEEQVSMSTRAGTFVTLADLEAEVGKDAARFFYLMRSSDSHFDFDLELAKSESKENPVYYVQYAHARIESIFRMAKKEGVTIPSWSDADLSRLELPEEIELIKQALKYPKMVTNSALFLEPHHITYYVQELAASFHKYYNRNKIISDDQGLTAARLVFVSGIQRVIKNALNLLGITPISRM